MVDDIYSSQLTLSPGIIQEHNFPSVTKMVFLENKSFEPIEVYWKDENGTYNVEPVVINRKQNQALKVKTDAIKVRSKSKAYLEVLSVIGDTEETKGGFYVLFDNTTPSPFVLKSLYVGNFIRTICVKIISAFDSGFSMAVGFPANPGELIQVGQVNCRKQAMYEFYPFRISQSNETLQATFYGSSSVGSGIIFIEE